jgi:hypothetical protein
MDCFTFQAVIQEDRTLRLPPEIPIGPVKVTILPAADAKPSGGRLLSKLKDLQTALPARQGKAKWELDQALHRAPVVLH